MTGIEKKALRLRISEDGSEVPLDEGMHALLRDASGLHVGVDGEDALARFCVDRRGVWMTVGPAGGSVHVNGRRVRRMAMLRAGDAIYVDGSEVLLTGGQPLELAEAVQQREHGLLAAGPAGVRLLLRGIGGRHHGRGFTLDRPRLIGSLAEADIRIDDPAFAERHAQIDQVDGQVVLRDLGSEEGSVVNGCPVRDAVLHPGDQIVFDGQHRFLLEGSGALVAEVLPDADDELVDDESVQRSRKTWRRWPWLLLAALLIAAMLGALLLAGSGQ